ncbi:MAG: hypothetical protein PHO75_02255 [Candidatus Shapirobacteria bacterium]|nr:hypothetical protein [Candidatus Shapirobacteria bacterium]
MIQEITLNSGVKVKIPTTFEYAKCRGCKASDIIWGITEKGKAIPVRFDDHEGWICHFEDCPKANEFRKEKKG